VSPLLRLIPVARAVHDEAHDATTFDVQAKELAAVPPLTATLPPLLELGHPAPLGAVEPFDVDIGRPGCSRRRMAIIAAADGTSIRANGKFSSADRSSANRPSASPVSRKRTNCRTGAGSSSSVSAIGVVVR
jgi:hypothetical protein